VTINDWIACSSSFVLLFKQEVKVIWQKPHRSHKQSSWDFTDEDKKPSCRWGVARARCQLKSGKILHKCLTDCTWKGLQRENNLQGHSRSLILVPHMMSFHWKYVSILYRFGDICRNPPAFGAPVQISKRQLECQR